MTLAVSSADARGKLRGVLYSDRGTAEKSSSESVSESEASSSLERYNSCGSEILGSSSFTTSVVVSRIFILFNSGIELFKMVEALLLFL